MTPLGSAGGSQERVRVVAVGEAISIAGGDPGTISREYKQLEFQELQIKEYKLVPRISIRT